MKHKPDHCTVRELIDLKKGQLLVVNPEGYPDSSADEAESVNMAVQRLSPSGADERIHNSAVRQV